MYKYQILLIKCSLILYAVLLLIMYANKSQRGITCNLDFKISNLSCNHRKLLMFHSYEISLNMWHPAEVHVKQKGQPPYYRCTACSYRSDANWSPTWIIAFRNGDKYHNGTRILVSPAHQRNFDNLLESLTKRLEPSFGAVRKVYSPLSGSTIRCLRDLKPNHKYVVAGKEQLQKISNGYLTLEEKSIRRHSLKPKKRKRLQSLNDSKRKGLDDNYSKISARYFEDAERQRRNIMTIFVHRNGDMFGRPIRVVLNEKDRSSLLWWGPTMHDIAERLNIGPIRAFYTREGKEVHTPCDLQNGRAYVAVCKLEKFINVPYKSPDGVPFACCLGDDSIRYLVHYLPDCCMPHEICNEKLKDRDANLEDEQLKYFDQCKDKKEFTKEKKGSPRKRKKSHPFHIDEHNLFEMQEKIQTEIKCNKYRSSIQKNNGDEVRIVTEENLQQQCKEMKHDEAARKGVKEPQKTEREKDRPPEGDKTPQRKTKNYYYYPILFGEKPGDGNVQNIEINVSNSRKSLPEVEEEIKDYLICDDMEEKILPKEDMTEYGIKAATVEKGSPSTASSYLNFPVICQQSPSQMLKKKKELFQEEKQTQTYDTDATEQNTKGYCKSICSARKKSSVPSKETNKKEFHKSFGEEKETQTNEVKEELKKNISIREGKEKTEKMKRPCFSPFICVRKSSQPELNRNKRDEFRIDEKNASPKDEKEQSKVKKHHSSPCICGTKSSPTRSKENKKEEFKSDDGNKEKTPKHEQETEPKEKRNNCCPCICATKSSQSALKENKKDELESGNGQAEKKSQKQEKETDQKVKRKTCCPCICAQKSSQTAVKENKKKELKTDDENKEKSPKEEQQMEPKVKRKFCCPCICAQKPSQPILKEKKEEELDKAKTEEVVEKKKEKEIVREKEKVKEIKKDDDISPKTTEIKSENTTPEENLTKTYIKVNSKKEVVDEKSREKRVDIKATDKKFEEPKKSKCSCCSCICGNKSSDTKISETKKKEFEKTRTEEEKAKEKKGVILPTNYKTKENLEEPKQRRCCKKSKCSCCPCICGNKSSETTISKTKKKEFNKTEIKEKKTMAEEKTIKTFEKDIIQVKDGKQNVQTKNRIRDSKKASSGPKFSCGDKFKNRVLYRIGKNKRPRPWWRKCCKKTKKYTQIRTQIRNEKTYVYEERGMKINALVTESIMFYERDSEHEALASVHQENKNLDPISIETVADNEIVLPVIITNYQIFHDTQEVMDERDKYNQTYPDKTYQDIIKTESLNKHNAYENGTINNKGNSKIEEINYIDPETLIVYEKNPEQETTSTVQEKYTTNQHILHDTPEENPISENMYESEYRSEYTPTMKANMPDKNKIQNLSFYNAYKYDIINSDNSNKDSDMGDDVSKTSSVYFIKLYQKNFNRHKMSDDDYKEDTKSVSSDATFTITPKSNNEVEEGELNFTGEIIGEGIIEEKLNTSSTKNKSSNVYLIAMPFEDEHNKDNLKSMDRKIKFLGMIDAHEDIEKENKPEKGKESNSKVHQNKMTEEDLLLEQEYLKEGFEEYSDEESEPHYTKKGKG